MSLAAILAALAFGRLVTALPLTPGGLGVMEVGLTSALLAVGDADQSAVVAAVLLFRFFTFALPIPLGALMWLFWTGKVARTEYSTDQNAKEPVSKRMRSDLQRKRNLPSECEHRPSAILTR